MNFCYLSQSSVIKEVSKYKFSSKTRKGRKDFIFTLTVLWYLSLGSTLFSLPSFSDAKITSAAHVSYSCTLCGTISTNYNIVR
jgi:glycopeptide antibiotics resistance protein